MGSNRKLLFGGLLVVAAIVFWGILTAINRVGQGPQMAANPTPASSAQSGGVSNKQRIAAATVDIPAGSIVTKEMLEMKDAPTGGAPAGFVTDPAAQAVGYVTRVPISKHDFLRADEDFIGHISEVGISAVLRPGTRAMVIPLANKPTLHDLVHIGDFIDVNAAFDGQEARPIVQNVRVIAVDVFGHDFPQVNIAPRGPYRADPKGFGSGPNDPNAKNPDGSAVSASAAPTATPAPAQAPPRPEPAITLEVTPTQANTILLAQASAATIDFVVRPFADAILVGDGIPTPGATPGPDGTNIRSISVTKAQIAPYAERKKAGGGTRTTSASSGGRGSGGGSTNGGRSSTGETGVRRSYPQPVPTFPAPKPEATLGPFSPPPSPTYDIPIYADSKPVRVETVRRPEELRY